MWATAMTCWYLANGTLSLTITFPVLSAGPAGVAALWGILVFKEVCECLHVSCSVYAHLHVCMCVCACVRVCVCACMCLCVRVCVTRMCTWPVLCVLHMFVRRCLLFFCMRIFFTPCFSLTGLCLFKIRGRRNYYFVAFAYALTIVGVSLIALSRQLDEKEKSNVTTPPAASILT